MKATFISLSLRCFQVIKPLSRILGMAVVFFGCLGNSTTAVAQTYITRFEGEECPLSEGGRWRNNGLGVSNGASYVQIVRWEGPLGKFTYLADLRGTNYGLKNGDILKASIIGNVITVFINGVQKAQVTDDTYKTGDPGIGMFLYGDGGRGLGSNTNYGLASFTARGLGAESP